MTAFLSLLKILGFLVLLVLGVLLLHLLLLLLVPLRYQLTGAFAEKKGRGNAALRWMLGYLSATAELSESGLLSVCLRVLGVQVWTYTKKLPLPGTKTDTEQTITEAQPQTVVPEQQTEKSAQQASEILNPVNTTETTGTVKTEIDEADQNAESARIKSCEDEPCSVTQLESSGKDAQTEQQTEQGEQQTGQDAQQEKHIGLFRKVQSQLENALTWLRVQLKSAAEKLKNARNKVDALVELLRGYKEFFLSEQHKETFLWIWQRLKRVLTELKPTEGNGELVFGTGDPYDTAQLLEPLAFLYPFYADWLDVVPELEKKIFSFRLDVKGRIYLRVLLVAALQLYFSKEVKALIKEFREVAEHG